MVRSGIVQYGMDVMVWLPDIFLHLELHGLVQYGEVRYGVACCCVV